MVEESEFAGMEDHEGANPTEKAIDETGNEQGVDTDQTAHKESIEGPGGGDAGTADTGGGDVGAGAGGGASQTGGSSGEAGGASSAGGTGN